MVNRFQASRPGGWEDSEVTARVLHSTSRMAAMAAMLC